MDCQDQDSLENFLYVLQMNHPNLKSCTNAIKQGCPRLHTTVSSLKMVGKKSENTMLPSSATAIISMSISLSDKAIPARTSSPVSLIFSLSCAASSMGPVHKTEQVLDWAEELPHCINIVCFRLPHGN